MKSIIFAALLSLSSTAVIAQTPQCDTRDTVIALLTDRYGESRRAIGIAGEAAVMELFASDESGTWTITMTLADGMTCLMASGQAFENVEQIVVPKGDPA